MIAHRIIIAEMTEISGLLALLLLLLLLLLQLLNVFKNKERNEKMVSNMYKILLKQSPKVPSTSLLDNFWGITEGKPGKWRSKWLCECVLNYDIQRCIQHRYIATINYTEIS